jgi:sirohydrochlorin ferrochelatase
MTVVPVSLLHSSGVDADELQGRAARLLEPTLKEYAEARGVFQAVALPLFFGPSAALTQYLPERLQSLRESYPDLDTRLARPLVVEEDDSIRVLAGAIADKVRQTQVDCGWSRPAVVLVDHGSPQPAVTAVRNRLAETLAEQLDAEVPRVIAASMERRQGDQYAFNEPLLESALDQLAADGFKDVIVAMQFLQPGRHAGPNGDVAEICAAARERHPALRTAMTDLLAHTPAVLTLLERRLREVIS